MTFDLVAPCPVRPDIDCVAGAVAYTEFCRSSQNLRAAPWLCGVPDGAAQFYIDAFPAVEWASEAEAMAASSYALIDFSTATPLPTTLDLKRVRVVIDHRFLHDPHNEFPEATIQLEAVGAAATLIAEKFMDADLAPSRVAAAMLHGAIHSNTLAFTSPLTTERDLAAFAWLAAFLPDADDLIVAYQAAHRAAIVENLQETLQAEVKEYILRDGPYLFSQIELQGAADLWVAAQDMIKAVLATFGPRSILNMVDTSHGKSITFTTDQIFNARLTAHYGTELGIDAALHLTPPQLRKQIAAILQA